MIGKLCRGPSRGGGSAYSLVEYLIGYAIAEKGATREEVADALDRIYLESETRQDCGAGAAWSPAAGRGTRPSSILARNCGSLMTASHEIDADAMPHRGVRTSAMHFVWSWNSRESGKITDEQAHEYVGKILEKLGLSEHRSVAVIHRDTIVYERSIDGTIVRDEDGNAIVRDGNLHVHCAVGAVDPMTGLAYNRTALYRRMAWAEREVELTYGLEHDHGLAVVQDAGRPTAHVRWADVHELAAWRAQRREERLVRQERRSFEAYRSCDENFERYADATVAPRLKTALELARQRGRNPDWATLHSVAARYGCELGLDGDKRVVVRDVGIGELRLANERERRDVRATLKAERRESTEIDERLAELRSVHHVAELAERDRKRESGETVLLASVLHDDLRDVAAFQTIEASEDAITARVEETPQIVLVDITAQRSTFSREDVDLWLGSRISNPADIERLGDIVVNDESVRVLSLDTMQPLMTTSEVQAVEDALARDATVLAQRPSGITSVQIERAIAVYEAQAATTRKTPFALSEEQRASLEACTRGSLVAIEGLPGVGKTTIQGVVRVLAEQTGREVVGLTLSQAAAERLESEAGFRCVNTAHARTLEERNTPVIPHGGIVVVDEAAMVDSRANGRILHLARERDCLVVQVGDLRQLQPIDFGASFRIVRDAALEVGTYTELRDIQRQRNTWHKEAVTTLADAVAERDQDKRAELVCEALAILDQHGAITWVDTRDDAIKAAVELAGEQRRLGRDTVTLASDRDTVRHLSERERDEAGLSGHGCDYMTTGGRREFAIGDRLMFLQNSLGTTGLGVRNGDRGFVIAAKTDELTVRLADRDVTFRPSVYSAFDYANASTVHKTQGASVDAAITVIDRSVSAELLFVAASRSREAVNLVVARSAFNDLNDLAEHISERILLKTTTHTHDELIERTGGRETTFVRHIEAQRESEPLRRLYDDEVAEPLRAIRAEHMDTARETYRRRTSDGTASNVPIEDQLEAKRDALRAFRKDIATIYRDAKPEPFIEWLHARDEVQETVRDLQDEREQTVRQDRNHEPSRWGSSSYLPSSFTEASNLAQEQDRGIER